jgi:hypothetical protein
MSWARLGVSVAVLSALVLGAIAVRSYPERAGEGYGFFTEYWCDLFDARTAAGDVNPGSAWAVAAASAVGVGLLVLFVERYRALGHVLGGAGVVGATAIVLVAVATALGDLELHRLLILAGAPFGLVGVVGAIVRSRGSWERGAGLTFLGLGVWNFTQYARQAVFEQSRWDGLPAVQKAATFALLAWLLLAAWQPRGPRHVGN